MRDDEPRELDLSPNEYRERKFPREWPKLLLGVGIGLAVLGVGLVRVDELGTSAGAYGGIVVIAAATGALIASLFRRWL